MMNEPTVPTWYEGWKIARARVSDRLHEARQAILAALPPGNAALVGRLDELYGEVQTMEQDLLIETLAQHFIGLAPAIRLVGEHVANGSPDRVLECCQRLPTD
jgi:hypothetical protein